MPEAQPGQEQRMELRERVRDFIYDRTKDELDSGWTLSGHQVDDLIEMIAAARHLTASEPENRS